MAESYHWDLWGAAYLLNFGSSDDGFDDFRGWLLAQGRAVWEAALRDPDGLAKLPKVRRLAPERRWEGRYWCQDILDVAYKAYEQCTGQSVTPENVCDVFGAVSPQPARFPAGERWDPDDDQQLRRRYPHLFAWHQAGRPA
jgi:Protein of unknown function (DUF4240)